MPSYTEADLGADEITRAAADKPVLSSNSLYTSGSSKWVTGSKTGTVASANNQDPDFPASRMTDGFPGYVSKPSSASTLFTVVINRTLSPVEFDWFGLMNHNLFTLSCTELRLQIASNSLFSTDLITPFTADISALYASDRRIAGMALETGGGVARRYGNVQYMRLQITCSSGVPEIGQIILGRRRQQKYNPEVDWGPDNQSSAIDRVTTRGGVRYKTARALGRRDIDAILVHDDTTLQNDLIDWWADIDAGNQNFFWHDQPATYPDNFCMFDLNEDTFIYPLIDWKNRKFNLVGSEQGPDTEYFSQGP